MIYYLQYMPAVRRKENIIAAFFRRLLKPVFSKPVIWAANKFSSAPNPLKVHESLSTLYALAYNEKDERTEILSFDASKDKVIIFSDHHKGTRDRRDDFADAEENYLRALDYYNDQGYYYVNLGDSEELWENTLLSVMSRNKRCFRKEKMFTDRDAYCKLVGNHDLFWREGIMPGTFLKRMYHKVIPVYEAVLLRFTTTAGLLEIFCTHGHQGDAQSDGNKFSKWFVSNIWGPVQAFLEINPNTPSTNDNLKTTHNQVMYEWSADQKKLALITGHTHQPVFRSLTHLERLLLNLEDAVKEGDANTINAVKAEVPRRRAEYDFVGESFRNMKPSYFNTGCCCFEDGTITGIEIADGEIRLVKWASKNKEAERIAERYDVGELLKNLSVPY